MSAVYDIAERTLAYVGMSHGTVVFFFKFYIPGAVFKDSAAADASLDLVAALAYHEGRYVAILLKESGEFARCVRVCTCV